MTNANIAEHIFHRLAEKFEAFRTIDLDSAIHNYKLKKTAFTEETEAKKDNDEMFAFEGRRNRHIVKSLERTALRSLHLAVVLSKACQLSERQCKLDSFYSKQELKELIRSISFSSVDNDLFIKRLQVMVLQAYFKDLEADF